MAHDQIDIDGLVSGEATFKTDILSEYDRSDWPDRIDYIAHRINEGDYAIGVNSSNPTYLSDGYDLEKTARDYYLRGIAALTGDRSRQTALPDDFRLGNLLVEFAGLSSGLEHVDRHDVPPGEILSRSIIRTVQRQADERRAQLAQQLRADTETPRELVAELTTVPEVAPLVESAIPDPDDPATLTTELASLDLTTELWDHQLESLALWLHHGMNAYVDMATATGKTVLGLAAVAHAVDSGSLHPSDRERLEDIFDGDLPDPHRDRPNDVLIVTTDDLLGVQWARLFQDHCHTPPSFTQVDDMGIQLPWGRIDIRSARGLADVDPRDYRLAIFDEVHNYSTQSGWGTHLVEFIESRCPVLALTGSVTDQLESLAEGSDRPFPLVYRYTHELALADGVIPDFEWTLQFTDVAETDALEQFRDAAEPFNRLVEYDSGTYQLEPDALADAASDLDRQERATITGEYVSGSALASALREAGDGDTAPTDELESLASGVSNRTIHRLNLRADLQPIVDAAEAALSEGRPTLVLTRSYKEAKEIWQALFDQHNDDRLVRRLDADQEALEQDKTIQEFDNAETDEKVLIGPGKRIGQGNDIKSVEVGINISRPGSGVNATLVQRLGRLLRDAGGKETVDFYHVIGVPPAEAVIEPDGESFVRSAADFFGQVLEPDTDGILKSPSVDILDGVETDVATLEDRGVSHVLGDDQSTAIESAYATAIDERTNPDEPTISGSWFTDAFGDEIGVDVRDQAGDGRVRDTADAIQETDDRETGNNGPSTESGTTSETVGGSQTAAENRADEGTVSEGSVSKDEKAAYESLTALTCIRHSKAADLYESGYESIDDLQNAQESDLTAVVGNVLARRIKQEVGGSGPAVSKQQPTNKSSDTTGRSSRESTDETGELTGPGGNRRDDVEQMGDKDNSDEKGSQSAESSVDTVTDGDDDESTDAADRVSPLAEHYDAFRSLGIIHKGLQKSADSELPESDPSARWIEDVRSILTEQGYGQQEIGYGIQQQTRSPVSIADYRAAHGTEKRVMEFEVVSVCEPSAAIEALLEGSLSELSSWVVPVTPESGVPLPVVVESEEELERARELLDEFPAEPPVFEDERLDVKDGGEDQDTDDSDKPPESADDRDTAPVPVEDVPSVPGLVATALRDAGYRTRTDLRQASDGDLEAIEGVSPQRVQMIRAIVGSEQRDQNSDTDRNVENEQQDRTLDSPEEIESDREYTTQSNPEKGGVDDDPNTGGTPNSGGNAASTESPSREDLLSELHRLEGKWSETVNQRMMLTTGKYHPDDYEAEFGSFELALDEADIGAGDAADEHRAELLDELRALDERYSEITRVLLYSVGDHHPDDYEEEFGSLDAALDEAGLVE